MKAKVNLIAKESRPTPFMRGYVDIILTWESEKTMIDFKGFIDKMMSKTGYHSYKYREEISKTRSNTEFTYSLMATMETSEGGVLVETVLDSFWRQISEAADKSTVLIGSGPREAGVIEEKQMRQLEGGQKRIGKEIRKLP